MKKPVVFGAHEPNTLNQLADVASRAARDWPAPGVSRSSRKRATNSAGVGFSDFSGGGDGAVAGAGATGRGALALSKAASSSAFS